ncbi:serine/threonine protein kinase [Roseimaritima ulvae]|uniref:Serine/threonine-protein kinase PknB n=1 Tax=Roseimaritima ulvae TaxID=980254 RepID=A0A5B9QQH6_9BACT|nr:serine/threonine protein kinase [Roseimaritima ulvae]QEG39765.1 Serine/threonine-protein kinase PknB [Roseimaritima ulvae]
MTPERYAVARQIFYDAEALPVGERRAFVEQQTNDPELRREVLSLLEFHDAEAAKAEGGTVKGGGSRTIVSDATETASMADLPSAIRVARGSQLSAPSHARLRRWLPLLLSLIVALPSLMAIYGVERKAESSLQSLRYSQLEILGDTAAMAVREWAEGKIAIVQSWARTPQLQHNVSQLVELARQDQYREALVESSARAEIHKQMVALGGQDVRYVFWNRNGTTLASWQADAGDVGQRMPAAGSIELARAFAGETLLHKPDRITEPTVGFIAEQDVPLMWLVTPIRDPQGRTQAVMLVRGIGLYRELTAIFDELDFEDSGDTYAVDDRGWIRTELRHTERLRGTGLLPADATSAALYLRAGDPGHPLSRRRPLTADAATLPLTIAVSRAAARQSGQTVTPYRNYQGVEVVGAWRWLPELEMGAVSEISVQEAFATLTWLRWSLLGLAAVLTCSAAVAGFVVDQRFREVRQNEAEQFGRYELLDELGSGGMGVVYRARHQFMKRPAALKVIRPDREGQESRLRFDREVQLAAGLRSPHSVSIFDYGWTNDGRAYCAMEMLEGLTVHQAVSRAGKMPAGRVLHLLMHVCDSLAEAHRRGLVHRDVKPRNIMLSPRGECCDWAVLFDFGLAKPTEPDHQLFHTQERVWAGTPMFMAPERFRSPGRTDPRSDIYSLGAVGYFMLAGREPFSEIDPSGLFELILTSSPTPLEKLLEQSDVQPLAALLQQCMHKQVEQRPQSADELYAQLAKLRDQFPWTRQTATRWWEHHGQDI